MKMTLLPGARHGMIHIPASKSLLHRLLLCGALGSGEAVLRYAGKISNDIAATIDCLRALGATVSDPALGAEMDKQETGMLRVTPIRGVPDGVCELRCGESGSTLRFLLPIAGALGARAMFRRAGRLPERPIAPLCKALTAHGMEISTDGARLFCEGKLLAGDYAIDGGVSSQYITGLLCALPLLDGDSTLAVTGRLESAPYVAMTEDALRLAKIGFTKEGSRYTIPGGQRFDLPAETEVEGDWSNAACFLSMGALSREGVTVTGLRLDSPQGDRAVLDVLRRSGAAVEEGADAVTVRRATLLGGVIDASQTPDLIPALAAVASVAGGETRIVNAARLRSKESDRLTATAAMLTALGADVTEQSDGLVIRGKPRLTGGAVDTAHDHRIAMAAAVAACVCEHDVIVQDAQCVEKSYSTFWEDVQCLSM